MEVANETLTLINPEGQQGGECLRTRPPKPSLGAVTIRRYDELKTAIKELARPARRRRLNEPEDRDSIPHTKII
jgi:hypothetical protein